MESWTCLFAIVSVLDDSFGKKVVTILDMFGNHKLLALPSSSNDGDRENDMQGQRESVEILRGNLQSWEPVLLPLSSPDVIEVIRNKCLFGTRVLHLSFVKRGKKRPCRWSLISWCMAALPWQLLQTLWMPYFGGSFCVGSGMWLWKDVVNDLFLEETARTFPTEEQIQDKNQWKELCVTNLVACKQWDQNPIWKLWSVAPVSVVCNQYHERKPQENGSRSYIWTVALAGLLVYSWWTFFSFQVSMLTLRKVSCRESKTHPFLLWFIWLSIWQTFCQAGRNAPLFIAWNERTVSALPLCNRKYYCLIAISLDANDFSAVSPYLSLLAFTHQMKRGKSPMTSRVLNQLTVTKQIPVILCITTGSWPESNTFHFFVGMHEGSVIKPQAEKNPVEVNLGRSNFTGCL